MIIDTHAHIYPDTIALRAATSISEFYDIPVVMDGTLSCLLERGKEAGISRFLVHSVALTHERVESINTYLMKTAAEYGEQLIGFGTMHPDYPNYYAELQRIKDGGLHGVKLHPDFQHFNLDDEKAIALFKAIADMGLPALVHTGDFRQSYSAPNRMANALDQVPNLKVICAHLGGWSVWPEGWKHLAGRENVWVDSSSSLDWLSPEEAVDIIHRFGVDRVFFGTDYPMWTPKEELARFMKLPLTDKEREKILHLNFEKFMDDL